MKAIPLLVGLRYTRAKRKNNFVSFISLVSMIGMTLGVMVLIIVLSVMNGFERELRERILGMVPHGDVQALSEQIDDWRVVADKVEQHPQVIAAAPFIKSEGMLVNENGNAFVQLTGIDAERQRRISDVAALMEEGNVESLAEKDFNIVLGADLAYALGVGIGDRISFFLPEISVNLAGVNTRQRSFTVTGIFRVGAEMDSVLAFTSLNSLARLKRMPEFSAQGVQFKLQDLFAARQVSREVVFTLSELQDGQIYYPSDWTYSQGGLFAAIQMEKRMIGLLLIMIVAVAGFNIVSSLIMLVTDKQSDIAILRTMGATPGQVMGIFMVQGSLIGFIGVTLGVILGVAGALTIEDIVAWFEQALGIQILSTDVYFINYLPSDLRWSNVAVIAGVSAVISLLATLYPSWRASRILPSEALRYE